MGKKTPFSPEREASFLSNDPAHLAYLLGNISIKKSQTPQGFYPAPKVRPQRKPHNFSATQRLSYEFFKSWVHEFSEGFTGSELKKAFRQAAIAVHPDHGGSTPLFLELKEHYEVLKSLVTP